MKLIHFHLAFQATANQEKVCVSFFEEKSTLAVFCCHLWKLMVGSFSFFGSQIGISWLSGLVEEQGG